MDATDAINNLAQILRKNGNQILSGESKFTLSVELLNKINELFNSSIEQRDVINNTFNIVPNRNNMNLALHSDLQFLHDFVQRTMSLKLTSASTNGALVADKVNISRFKTITLLDLQKISAEQVTGIRQLRPQIQFLICTRSLTSFEEILERCGGDESTGFQWTELREAIFRNNDIEEIGDSFEFTPWLVTLDLSHNLLRDVDKLNCLQNIKNLNLGYNKITRVPQFSGSIANRLQVLVLRNNCLDSLSPLTSLTHLSSLDLRDNCLLSHHPALSPLAHLANLQWLQLAGNPLYYHPRHRTRTCCHLHGNTASVRFVLDGAAVSADERSCVGTVRAELVQQQQQQQWSGTSVQRQTTTTSGGGGGGAGGTSGRRVVRNVEISDDEEQPVSDSIAASLSSLNIPEDHLETKKQIELLRELHGNNWLQAHAGSLVQEALGLEPTPLPLSSTPYESDFLIHASEVVKTTTTVAAAAAATSASVTWTDRRETTSGGKQGGVTTTTTTTTTEGEEGGIVDLDATMTTYVTANNTMTMVETDEVNTSSDTDKIYPQKTTSLTRQEASTAATSVIVAGGGGGGSEEPISEDEEIGEGEQNLYLATVDGETVFVILTQTHLTERACTSTRERARWPLKTLLTCQAVLKSIELSDNESGYDGDCENGAKREDTLKSSVKVEDTLKSSDKIEDNLNTDTGEAKLDFKIDGKLKIDDQNVDDRSTNSKLASKIDNNPKTNSNMTTEHFTVSKNTEIYSANTENTEMTHFTEFLLEFNTLRANRKRRVYLVDDRDEATRLQMALQAVVERNAADESNYLGYTCMKCSTSFHIERHNHNHNGEKGKLVEGANKVVCPTCKTTLVIRDS